MRIDTGFIGMSLGLAVVMVLIGLLAVTLARWLEAPDPLAYVMGSTVVLETLLVPADGPGPHWLVAAATAIAGLWARFAWDRRKSVAPREGQEMDGRALTMAARPRAAHSE